MGNFGKWLKAKNPEALNELNTLGRAQMKSDKAYGAVSDAKFNTVGGLAQIIQGELEQILKRRESEDPSKDRNVLLNAMKMAFKNIIAAHKSQAAMPAPTV
jgi:hypothetical protein